MRYVNGIISLGFLLLAGGALQAQAQEASVPNDLDLIERLLETRSCPNCNLQGVDLSGAFLVGADLRGAVLTSADLSGARLSDADLTNANLENANLKSAILNRANLTGANLAGVNLSSSRLFETNFQNSILTNADMQGAEFKKTDLRNAVLENANLRDAQVLSWLDEGTVFCRTIEPNGTPINRDCKSKEIGKVSFDSSKDSKPQPHVSPEFRRADWTVISEVGRAQRLLAALGYEPGKVDGIWGRGTRLALVKFLESAGKKFDGKLSGNEIELLEVAANVQGISSHPKVSWKFRSGSPAQKLNAKMAWLRWL